MNTRPALTFGAGALAASALTLLVATGPDQGAPDEPTPQDDMMAAYMALGEPGDKHEDLTRFVGSWEAKTRFAMDPQNPEVWTEGEGSCEIELIMDGRFIRSEFSSDFTGVPFTGVGYNGYDNGRQSHVATWIDSLSTSITSLKGTDNKDGDIEMTGMSFAPGIGEYQMRMVYAWEDDDTWSQTFYDQQPDGSWFNSGSITYTRR